MAYSELTSLATPADVIDAIATFAAANGWTVDRNDLVGANRTVTLHKAGVSDYVHIYNTSTVAIFMSLSVGYDGGLPPASQPNPSGFCQTYLLAGPYPKAFLFASGDQVWVTLAIARSGEYRHLTFGVLEKIGVYDGGTYCDGTEWGLNNRWAMFTPWNHAPFCAGQSSSQSDNGVVRADVPDDSRTNFFFRFGHAPSGTTPATAATEIGNDAEGVVANLVSRADKNAFSGRSVLHPIAVFVSRTGSATYYSPIGVVQDVRYCSLDKFEPEQEVPIGSDTYVVFPVAGKRAMNSTSGDQPAASGDFGYAIRKVV